MTPAGVCRRRRNFVHGDLVHQCAAVLAMAREERLAHPLCGVTFPGLLRLVSGAHSVPAAAWPWLAYYAALALLRSPATLAETAWLAARRTEVAPPLFVIGHWRSGTTHLHGLLAQAPRFAFLTPVGVGLPAERLSIGRPLEPILQRLAPVDRGIDAVRVDRQSPQEDEIQLASLGGPSCYHAYYLPTAFERRFREGVFVEGPRLARWLKLSRTVYERLAIERPGARPLIKNPVYTGRVHALAAAYPGAQFVHCARDPEAVYASTLRYHTAMLDKLRLHRADISALDELVLDTYVELMERYLLDVPTLGERAVVEVRYEELVARPLAVLERVYDGLGLDGFDDDLPHFERYVDRNAGYRSSTHRSDAATRRRIKQRWEPIYACFGYSLDEQQATG